MSPVLVLHGFTGRGAAMNPLVSRLADFDVIAPDLAGHGGEQGCLPEAEYTVEGMADRVLGLTAETVHLVGYSMGGRVALAAATRAPERVRSLSLIGASAGIVSPDEATERAAADEALALEVVGDFCAFVDRWMKNPLFATQVRLGPEAQQVARSLRLTNDPAGLAMSLRHGGTGQMRSQHERLGRCVMPVGLMVGDEDRKFCAIAADLAAALPDAVVHTIPGSGHATHLERPELTAAAVRHTIGRSR